MRPALGHGYGMQTPSDNILFFRGTRQAEGRCPVAAARHSLYARVYTEFFPEIFFSPFFWVEPVQPVQPVQLTICFVSTRTNSMKCLIDWILLNSHVRFEQNPTLLEYRAVSYSSFATPGQKKKTCENGGSTDLRMISAAAKGECDS